MYVHSFLLGVTSESNGKQRRLVAMYVHSFLLGVTSDSDGTPHCEGQTSHPTVKDRHHTPL